MAWYLRKALSFGPVRLNLSKGGLGVSLGVKGARVGVNPRGQRYVHLGRHGIYYRKAISSPDKSQESRLPDLDPTALLPVASVGVEHLTDDSAAGLLEDIRRVHNRIPRLRAVLLLGAAACTIAWWRGADSVVILALLVMTAICAFWGHYEDSRHGHISLTFDMDEETRKAFEGMVAVFKDVVAVGRIRCIRAQGVAADRRREGGAGRLVDVETVHATIKSPPHTTCSVSILCLPSGRQQLYLCPDRILVYQGSNVGSLRYEDLTIVDSVRRFVEREDVPDDTTIVDHTWQYANEDGTPDRRFGTNEQLPVVLYGELALQSSAGLTCLFQLSSVDVARRFARALRGMGRAAPSHRIDQDRERSFNLSESVEVPPKVAPSEEANTPGLGKEKVEELQGEVLRYANERPPGWEYLLFGHALIDALDSSRANEASPFGAAPVLRSDALALSWCTQQLEEPKRLWTTLERLVNHDLAEALGPEGQPGSPEALVRVAREIAAACLRAREWAAWILRAEGSAKLTAAVHELAQTIDESIREVETLGARIVDSTESALGSQPGSPARHIELTIQLKIANKEALDKVLKALAEPSDPLPKDA